MPILWALADPKIGEREVLTAMLEVDADLVADRPGLLLITDKGFAGKKFEQSLRADHGIALFCAPLVRRRSCGPVSRCSRRSVSSSSRSTTR